MSITKNKKIIIILFGILIILVLGISVLGRSNYFSKNEEITLINQNKEEVIYKSDKDVLVVSTICATCKEELDQLSKSSKSEQEQVNIIVMSTFEQACAFVSYTQPTRPTKREA
ncbi:hypothetical protein CG709_01825 [Lachnotalea glycerini]|nr:hypothetical protein CG709_01825 [Lachnotalea glycerini]